MKNFIQYIKRTEAMHSEQIFMIIVMVAALGAAMIATPVIAEYDWWKT